ncbi:hypothetical protein M8J76_011124 [Diaphorina citri]|nr:hypothetical protein M8J76_011124 [Diaphorina citri]
MVSAVPSQEYYGAIVPYKTLFPVKHPILHQQTSRWFHGCSSQEATKHSIGTIFALDHIGLRMNIEEISQQFAPSEDEI